MAENDPFAAFTLADIFSEVYTILKNKGELVETAQNPQLTAGSSSEPLDMEETAKQKAQREFEEMIIKEGIKIPLADSIREMTPAFKIAIEYAKSNFLLGNYDQETKLRWGNITLLSLAITARKKFKSLTEESGRALPESPEHQRLQQNATDWEIRSQVAQAAAELQN